MPTVGGKPDCGRVARPFSFALTDPGVRLFRVHDDLRDVIEMRAHNERGDSTFRCAYTVELGDTVYVLHAFQEKSKRGISTPKLDLDLVRQRLKQAREHYEQEKHRTRN